jgi:hypothetical protein
LETTPTAHRDHAALLLHRQGDRGRVVIYRPTGEVLRLIELPQADPNAAS